MSGPEQPAPVGKAALWIGRVISFLPALLLLAGGVMSAAKTPDTVSEMAKFGYQEKYLVPLGIVTIISVVLYLIPQTAVLGAILLTGYLGGAVATHVQHGDPAGKIFFPPIFGAVLWFGLWLRDRRIRELVPVRTV